MDHLTLTRAMGRMKWGKRRESMCSRFLFEMQEHPGDDLPEVYIPSETDGLTPPATPGPIGAPRRPPELNPRMARLQRNRRTSILNRERKAPASGSVLIAFFSSGGRALLCLAPASASVLIAVS